MSHVTQQTAWALKHAGLPQPEPEFGQIWHTGQRETKIVICGPVDFQGDYPRVPDNHTDIYAGEKEDWAFAPDLDYIAQFLPEGFVIEMWDGRHSCKVDNADYIIRTQADNFAEAAALCYMSINESPG